MEMEKEMNIQKLIADDGIDLDHMYSILENAGLTQYLIVKRVAAIGNEWLIFKMG